MIMMPCDGPWTSLQLTGQADCWHPAGRSSRAWGAAGPERRALPGRPSSASAAGSAAAAPPPHGAAPAARRLSTSKNVPAAPSTRPGGRTSGRACVSSRARDPARHATLTAGEPASQQPMPRFGTPQVYPDSHPGSATSSSSATPAQLPSCQCQDERLFQARPFVPLPLLPGPPYI